VRALVGPRRSSGALVSKESDWKCTDLLAFMVSLSNHEGLARAFVRRFMVRQAHHEAFSAFSVRLKEKDEERRWSGAARPKSTPMGAPGHTRLSSLAQRGIFLSAVVQARTPANPSSRAQRGISLK